MFRFKTEGLPQTNIPYSQSLWCLDPSPSNITLTYTGSGYASSSYRGSINAGLPTEPDTGRYISKGVPTAEPVTANNMSVNTSGILCLC